VLLREFEDTMVEFLEKGAVVESDVLANVKTMLPAEVCVRDAVFMRDGGLGTRKRPRRAAPERFWSRRYANVCKSQLFALFT
jgi:hypothetical protein